MIKKKSQFRYSQDEEKRMKNDELFASLSEANREVLMICEDCSYNSVTFNGNGVTLWAMKKAEAQEACHALKHLGIKCSKPTALFEDGQWRRMDECEHRWIVNVEFSDTHNIKRDRLEVWAEA